MQAALEMLRGFRLAVVTGGSSGIGKRFLTTIVEANPKVCLCNLSREKPEVPGDLVHVACDLADATAREAAFARVAAWAAAADAGRLLVINNAGFGTIGPFPEPKMRHHAEMIAVNVSAMVELTGVLLGELRRRGGAVINVASTAAFQPLPGMQTYAATKAFVLHWSVALARELAGTGVQVQALCPGPTRTDFGRRSGFGGVISPRLSHDVDSVVGASLRGLQRGRIVVVPGFLNAFGAMLARRLPLRLAATLAERTLRRTGHRSAPARPPAEAASGGKAESASLRDDRDFDQREGQPPA